MYGSVIFSGGGCRCFWQAGFLEVVSPEIDLRPRAVGAVSAGAAMACMIFAGVTRAGLAAFKEVTARNRRNVYWSNALRGEPMFPHARMYRDTILSLLDASRLEVLRAGPDIRVQLSRTPPSLGPWTALIAAAILDQAQRLFARRLHRGFARRAGFHAETVSVRECRTPAELAELILHSSCTPPFTPYYRRGGRPTLDGGLIDSVPVETVDGEFSPALILLTRPHAPREIPPAPGRHYVWPSREVPVSKWDYTSAAKVQACFDLGRADGERFLASGRGR